MHARLWGSFPNLPVSLGYLLIPTAFFLSLSACHQGCLESKQDFFFFLNSSAMLLQVFQGTERAQIYV